MLESHTRWRLDAEEKLKAVKGKEVTKEVTREGSVGETSGGKGARDEMVASTEPEERLIPPAWTVQDSSNSEWITDRELLE